MQSTLNQPDADTWAQVAPVLDDALNELGEADRTALVLRYFENKTVREIADALRLEESAAQKRVTRALEKLRKLFIKRGVTLTGAVIAGAVAANSVQAAPAGLAVTVTAAKGTAVGGSTLILAKGALKLMAWAKAKLAIVLGTAVLLTVGTTAVVVVNENRMMAWRTEGMNIPMMYKVPAQVRILPSKFHHGWGTTIDPKGKLIGVAVGFEFIVQAITGTHYWRERMVFPAGIPLTNRYDVIANLPAGSREAFTQKAQHLLGITARKEVRDTGVLILKFNPQGARRLFPRGTYHSNDQVPIATKHYIDASMEQLVQDLERDLEIPVFNETGLTNSYDFEVKMVGLEPGTTQADRIEQTQADFQNGLGLELVPTNMPIEMLVVEKVK